MIGWGNKIKKSREKYGLEQSDLADMLGKNRATISHYECEAREPNIESIVQLSKILNVSADYLLGLQDDGSDSDTPDRDSKLIVELNLLSHYKDHPNFSKCIRLAANILKHGLNIDLFTQLANGLIKSNPKKDSK